MKAIYLIQKDPKLAPKPESPKDPASLWTSGFWAITAATAVALKGGRIFFHKKQLSPATCGGVIVDFSVVEEGVYAGRVIFRFQNDPAARGTKTGREGWAMEKKIVLEGEMAVG